MSKNRPKVLFVSSEVYPFAKSGGLADVSIGLPTAMSENYNLSIMMPLYQFIDKEAFDIRSLGLAFKISMGRRHYPVEVFSTLYKGMLCYFIDSPILSQKSSLYGTPESGYEDNDLRFGLFCKAVISFLKRSEASYELLHLNDWQTALCALFLKEEPALKLKCIYTIHNLAYQGLFDKHCLKALDIPEVYFHLEALEFYGQVSLMKAGIAYAHAVTTVSPNYAKEILTPEFGCGLEGFLSKYKTKVHGILNGIDLGHFSPQEDTELVSNYSSQNYHLKQKNKVPFLKERHLRHEKRPLFIFVGRFTWQKGIDLFIQALKTLSELPINIAILGDGEAHYHESIDAIASKHGNIDLCFGYDEARSHRMYAAADFLLMPSFFEPCGLNQMIAMQYGTLPIVHSVGGLKDSVHPLVSFDNKVPIGFGIGFESKEAEALIEAVQTALELYEDKERFEAVNRHNMLCDFSWKQGSKAYAALYDSLIHRPTQRINHG